MENQIEIGCNTFWTNENENCKSNFSSRPFNEKKKKNFSHFLIFFLNISCTFVQHLKVLLGSIFFKYCIRSQSAQHPLQVRVKIIEKEKNQKNNNSWNCQKLSPILFPLPLVQPRYRSYNGPTYHPFRRPQTIQIEYYRVFLYPIEEGIFFNHQGDFCGPNLLDQCTTTATIKFQQSITYHTSKPHFQLKLSFFNEAKKSCPFILTSQPCPNQKKKTNNLAHNNFDLSFTKFFQDKKESISADSNMSYRTSTHCDLNTLFYAYTTWKVQIFLYSYSLAFRAFHTIQQFFMIFLSDTILIGTFYSVMVKGKETLLVFIAKKKSILYFGEK